MSAPVRRALFRPLMRLYRRLFARKRFYAVNKLLFNLSLRGLGVLKDGEDNLAETGERAFLRRVAATWGNALVVFDVGAHTGQYAAAVRQLAPGAAVYAFEPHPKTFALLREAAHRHGFLALNVGCGDRQGAVPMYDVEGGEGSPLASVHRSVVEQVWRFPAAATSVQLITLDDFMRERGLAAVHLVKIDTEGHERMVVEGLRVAIARDAVDLIQFEFNEMNVVSRSFFRDFYGLLPRHAFYRMLPDGLVPLGDYSAILCELFGFQNIVAARRGCGFRP